MTKIKTVRLYGKLGRMFGREFRLAVNSPAEAVRALAAQLPGFEAHFMSAHKNGVGFAVFAGERNLDKSELHHPSGDDVIKFAPVLLGAKGGGWLNVVLGAALIAVSFVIPAGPILSQISAGVMAAGVGMAIGGVVQLLSPTPRGIGATDSPDNRPSHNFQGPVNTSAQGNSVPVLYGRMIVGSAVISAGIIAEDDVYVPTDGDRGGGGSGGGGSPPWHLEWAEQDR